MDCGGTGELNINLHPQVDFKKLIEDGEFEDQLELKNDEDEERGTIHVSSSLFLSSQAYWPKICSQAC